MGEDRASSQKSTPRRRGRPPGRSEKGAATADRLYRVALGLFASEGYSATTMRRIAREAGVSAGLLYRYFDSKEAVVLSLYEQLGAEHAHRMEQAPAGRWAERFGFGLETSLAVLGPHRDVLAALLPILVSRGAEGLFSAPTGSSRAQVMAGFEAAVTDARDAPADELRAPLGRLLYLAQLLLILWWLLDASPQQRATGGMQRLMVELAGVAAPALRFGPVGRVVRRLDALARDALL